MMMKNEITHKKTLHFFFIAVILFWAKSYLAFKMEFSLETENFLQQLILALSPISSGLFFFGLSLFFSGKSRNRAIITIDLILSFVLYLNIVYHRFFDDFLTIPVLLQFKNFRDLGGSAEGLMQPYDFLYFLDFFILCLLILMKKVNMEEKINSRTAAIVFISAFSIFITDLGMAETQRPELLTRSFDRAILVKLLGLYNYHIYDAVLSTRSSTQRAMANGNDLAEVKNYVDAQYKPPDKNFFGAARGDNVILVSLESTQAFLINYKLNGQEVTPFLNSLTKDSFYFDHFYHNTGQGKTSDAEFLIDNSLYGLPGGAVYTTKAQNRYLAIPQIIKKIGYSSVVLHGNHKSFWNRDIMYQALGYDQFFAKQYFKVTKENSVNYGIKDIPFFEQSVPLLKRVKQPFYAKLITLTNHYPFILNNKQDQLIHPAQTGDTTVDHYFVTARYEDEALRRFFVLLKQSGFYNHSIIILYGDHYGISEKHNNAMSEILEKEITPFEHINLQKIPLFIHIPGKRGKNVHTIGGEIDLKPTILHLLGVQAKNDVSFGSDLFSKGREDFTVLRDGSVITKKFVYSAPKEKCYSSPLGAEVDIANCQPLIDRAKKELELSDKVVYGDLLRFLKGKKNLKNKSIRP